MLELVTQSFHKSFFEKQNIQVATARAGNVIGGGDWSKDDCLPDIFRAFSNKQNLKIRSLTLFVAACSCAIRGIFFLLRSFTLKKKNTVEPGILGDKSRKIHYLDCK